MQKFFDVEIWRGIPVSGTFEAEDGCIISITMPDGVRLQRRDLTEPNDRHMWALVAAEIEATFPVEIASTELHPYDPREHTLRRHQLV